MERSGKIKLGGTYTNQYGETWEITRITRDSNGRIWVRSISQKAIQKHGENAALHGYSFLALSVFRSQLQSGIWSLN